MRSTASVVLASALIGLSGLLATSGSEPSSSWLINSTEPFYVSKWSIEDVGTSKVAYLLNGTASGKLRSAGASYGCVVRADVPTGTAHAASIDIFAGAKSKFGPLGGKYSFAGDREDPVLFAGFCDALSYTLEGLDDALPLAVPLAKGPPFIRLAGDVLVEAVKASGSTKVSPDGQVGSGKFKVAWAGQITSGPNAGRLAKGSLSLAYRDAAYDDE